MTIKELEKIMIEQGVILRAIPLKIHHVYADCDISLHPDGRLEYHKEYKREMTIVDSIPKNAGKFVIESEECTGAMARFYGKKLYDNIEDAIADLPKNK